MTLLAPWALWFAVIGAGVVALYLLKIKRRQASVPALDFWLDLAGRTKVHSLFERLKRLLSMLLWLLIVACLVLALGNPILSLGRAKPRAIAIVLDNSASMQATEPDEASATRLALAKRAIEQLTTGRPVVDEWLLIEAGREPRVLQPWTFDSKSVRRRCEEIQPFAGSGNLASAVELAGQLATGKNDPCIVVVSDGAAGALEPIAKNDTRVVHWPIGKTSDNLGIGRLSVRAHRQQSNYHALISVVNSSDEKVDTSVTLEINGSAHGVELVSVEPHATWEKTVVIENPQNPDGTSGSGGVLRVSLDRADLLMLDNEAFAVLQPIRPAVVWLVTVPQSAFFFEQALGSMDALIWAEESLTLSPEKYEVALAALKAAANKSSSPPSLTTPPSPDSPTAPATPQIKKPDLIVFNGWAPESLPTSGRFVLINAWPKDIPVNMSGDLETPHMFMAPRPHPLTQHVTLQGARLGKARRVALKEPATVLAHSTDGDPLIFLVDQPDRQSLCVAFDVMDSDLPFRNAFPLLLRNAVAFMHEDAPSWLRSDYRIGETVRPLRPLPAGTKQVELGTVRAGKTETSSLPVQDGQFLYKDTGSAGALRVTIGDEASYAAVNISDPNESRITPPSLAADDDPAKKLALSGRLLGAMPWIGLVALAAMVIALEWLTYHFRWTE